MHIEHITSPTHEDTEAKKIEHDFREKMKAFGVPTKETFERHLHEWNTNKELFNNYTDSAYVAHPLGFSEKENLVRAVEQAKSFLEGIDRAIKAEVQFPDGARHAHLKKEYNLEQMKRDSEQFVKPYENVDATGMPIGIVEKMAEYSHFGELPTLRAKLVYAVKEIKAWQDIEQNRAGPNTPYRTSYETIKEKSVRTNLGLDNRKISDADLSSFEMLLQLVTNIVENIEKHVQSKRVPSSSENNRAIKAGCEALDAYYVSLRHGLVAKMQGKKIAGTYLENAPSDAFLPNKADEASMSMLEGIWLRATSKSMHAVDSFL